MKRSFAIWLGLLACHPQPVNLPPQARAGLDRVIGPGDVIRLDGSASSDPEGALAAWRWRVLIAPPGDEASLSSPHAPMTELLGARVGNYVLELVVVDEAGQHSAPDCVGVTVQPHVAVTAVAPRLAETPVSPMGPLVVVFDGVLQPDTVSPRTLGLTNGRHWVPVTVGLSADQRMAALRPVAPLESGAQYRLEITRGVLGLAGYGLGAPASLSFVVQEGPDVVGPKLVHMWPGALEAGASVGARVTLLFSEPIDPATLTQDTVQLAPPTPAAFELEAHGMVVYVVPQAPLVPSQRYTVTIANGLRDMAGNPGAGWRSEFTVDASDTRGPTVAAVYPGAYQDVSRSTTVLVELSEEIHAASAHAISLVGAAGTVPASLHVLPNGRTVLLSPEAILAPNTVHEVRVGAGLTDTTGNPLEGGDYVSRFRTGATELDHFFVTATPTSPAAGTSVAIVVRARDAEQDVVSSYRNVAPIALLQNAGATGFLWSGPCVTDHGDGSGELAAGCFSQGETTVQLTSGHAVGPVTISVTEHDTGLLRSGTTALAATSPTWVPGSVARFDVSASPTGLPAGFATTVSIVAADAFNNPVPGYTPPTPIVVSVSAATPLGDTFSFTGPGITSMGAYAHIAAGTSFGSQGDLALTVANAASDADVVIAATEQGTGWTGSTADSGTNVSWTSTCSPPFAVAQLVSQVACEIAVTGVDSFDGGNPPLTYAWSVQSVPPGSNIATGDLEPSAASPTVSFRADAVGTYVLRLRVTNACGGRDGVNLQVVYSGVAERGSVVMNEVLTDPVTDWDGSGSIDHNDELVELYNTTACVVDITGWSVRFIDSRNSSYTFGGPLGGRTLSFSEGSTMSALRPGGFVVILDVDGNGANRQLDDSCYLRVVDASLRLIDDVEVGDNLQGDAVDDGAPGGPSTSAATECVARSPDGADTNTDAVDFVRTFCTPGGPNSGL